MKKLLIILILIFPFVAFAQFTTFQGGTGTTSPSGILLGDATLHLKTLKIGSGLLLSGGILSSTAAGGTVTQIDTNSPLTGGPITTTGTISLQAASASQIGSMSTADFQLLHTATTTFSSPLVYTLGTNAVTCPTCSTITTPISIANGGTNASSFTTSGNGVYFDGTSLLTAPLTTSVTYPYASTTAISSTNASTSKLTASISLAGGQYVDGSPIPTTVGYVIGGSQVTNVVTAPISQFRIGRSGTSAARFALAADFKLGAWSVSGSQSRTQLDIALAHGGTTIPEVTVLTLLSNQSLGVGSSTPWGLLSIDQKAPGSIAPLLTIASSSAIATSTAFQITAAGHIIASTTNPVLSSCGTGPTILGDDTHGEFIPGTAASGCTITFQIPYSNAPVCTVSNQSLSVVNGMTYTISTTALTVTMTGIAGDKVDYICLGIKGIN